MTRSNDILPGDADGKIFTTSAKSFIVPARVELSDDYLLWGHTDPEVEKTKKVQAGLGAFKAFLKLTDAQRVLLFAQRYGPLRLCGNHGLPLTHALTLHYQPGRSKRVCRPMVIGTGYAEPLSAWYRISQQANAINRIIRALSDGKRGDEEHWRLLRHSPVRPVFLFPVPQTVSGQRVQLLSYLNAWLDVAGVTVRFRRVPKGSEFEPILSGGLFGFIGLELVALLCEQRHGIDICSICFQPYSVITRKSAEGKLHLCGEQRCKQQANRLAKVRERRRARSSS
jgi:hypothetical protein